MNATSTIHRPATILALLAAAATLALALLAGPAAPRAAAAELRCPATFKVLHDDRIGELKLKAGNYRITVIDDQKLTCEKAATKFAQFLQDFDGELPGRWKLNAAKASFRQGPHKGFSVERVGGGGGGGGGRHPSGKHTECPTFQVLHNDRIGDVEFPKGTYQMTALKGFACEKASRKFAQFLEDVEGELPGNWVLKGKTGTFLRGDSGKGFQVNFWR